MALTRQIHNRSVGTWTTIYMTIGGIECGCPCEAKLFACTFKVMEDHRELLGREQDSVLKCECLPMCASWQGPNLLSVSPLLPPPGDRSTASLRWHTQNPTALSLSTSSTSSCLSCLHHSQPLLLCQLLKCYGKKINKNK